MNFFSAILHRIKSWETGPLPDLDLQGVSPGEMGLLFEYYLRSLQPEHEQSPRPPRTYFFITPSIEKAENLYTMFKHWRELAGWETIFFPGLEFSPYTSALPSEHNLYRRFSALDLLQTYYNKKNFLVFCTYEALLLRQPPPDFFKNHTLSLEVSDIVSPEELAHKLVALGYVSSTTTEEQGTFSRKGEIFDIYPLSHRPVRLHYFDDMIEAIHLIDQHTQKTVREVTFEQVHLSPAPHILSRQEFSTQLRSQISMPGPQFRNKFQNRKLIFEQLSDNYLFEGYPSFVPLFFKESSTILDYVDSQNSFFTLIDEEELQHSSVEYFEEIRQEFESEDQDVESSQVLPDPSKLYLTDLNLALSSSKKIKTNKLHIGHDIDETDLTQKINIPFEDIKTYLGRHITKATNKHEFINSCFKFLKNEFKDQGGILFCYNHENSKKEIAYLINLHEFSQNLKNRIHFEKSSIEEGFYYVNEKLLVISEGDLFSRKLSKVKKTSPRPKLDLFAEQLATLKVGDYVVHQDYGIGSYQGLKTISIGSTESDFLEVIYEGNDKVYVPVYKMDLIQKHADSTHKTPLSNLNTKKFQQSKERAKQSAKSLAFDLLKLQAEREATEAFAFSAPDHYYHEFELAFSFEETADQLRAIQDVLDDMQKPHPMDRLVCGDVGFGKTEVAMRAAFKAVLDKKQVAVLVPTTLLALQHYNSFSKRFKDFPVKIEYLSRFKSAKESKDILNDLSEGKIDILIGTHKLLSKQVEFYDLGLVVVDEEQRFGVGHKEKLKLLKSSVDFLTLTATPIPRTLQLAFLGLKDLSLIQTPPPKRQSIKSYIIKEDDHTLKTAIEKELQRGGQVFYVHNRVQDIEQESRYLKELVPKAKILVAHGQMPEKELEKKMNDFYSGKYQILLSTTIIESGLDIPTANTMIIDRADTFGLAQLHQLRGRIGRSDKKAYAYFVIPEKRQLNTLAQKRLQALQTYAELGSGFSMATSDLEIRGAGDILGADQSGHIESIGLELYMQLLQEAVLELKGERNILRTQVEIQTPDPAFIPNHYIPDSSLRLKYYKKLANSKSHDELEEIAQELTDIFGPYGTEVKNLLTILQVKVLLQNMGLLSIKTGGMSAVFKFDKAILEQNTSLRDKVVEFFLKKPKTYQLKPDFSVIYTAKEKINSDHLLQLSKHIAQQIVPC